MICSYCNLDKEDQDEKEKVQVLQEDSLSLTQGLVSVRGPVEAYLVKRPLGQKTMPSGGGRILIITEMIIPG